MERNVLQTNRLLNGTNNQREIQAKNERIKQRRRGGVKRKRESGSIFSYLGDLWVPQKGGEILMEITVSSKGQMTEGW